MFLKLRRVAAASAVAVAPLLGTIMAPGLAHAASGDLYKWSGASSSTAGLNGCTVNCWSVAGNWSKSVDNGVTYATATTAPVGGENIVFDNALLTSADVTTTDDISNLSIGSFATTGTSSGSYRYNISGQALTITGGVVSASGAVSASNDIAFSGDQAYGSSSSGAALSLSNADVTISSGTLTSNAYFSSNSTNIAAGATLKINNGGYGDLAGAGSLVIASPAANSAYSTQFSVYDAGNASAFSGTITAQRGTTFSAGGDNPANVLGTASVVIEDGGQLALNLSPNTPSSTGTINLPNKITMGGNGGGVSQMNQGAIIAGLYDGNSQQTAGTLAVNLTGQVTLTSDTKLASVHATATTYNFTGALNQNGHVLGAVAAVQPTYGVTTVQVNGKTVAGGANNLAPAAPKTPDTGFALAAAHPAQTLLGTLIATAAIAGVAFKTRKNPVRR